MSRCVLNMRTSQRAVVTKRSGTSQNSKTHALPRPSTLSRILRTSEFTRIFLNPDSSTGHSSFFILHSSFASGGVSAPGCSNFPSVVHPFPPPLKAPGAEDFVSLRSKTHHRRPICHPELHLRSSNREINRTLSKAKFIDSSTCFTAIDDDLRLRPSPLHLLLLLPLPLLLVSY